MKPNILFLSLDGFRPDRCYSKSKSSKTPGLDYLIRKGTWCNRAFCCSDSTHSSFASTLTGIYPFKSAISKKRYFKLNTEMGDYVNHLRNNGYHTHVLMPDGIFLDEFTKLFESKKDSTYKIFESRLYNGLGTQIIEKLDSNKMTEPWLFFIHLMDTHKPIYFPDEFDNDDYGKDEYDKLISSVDVWINKIIQKIDLENTIVVLTADHGDYLRVIERKGKRISFEYRSLATSFFKVSKVLPSFLYQFKMKTSLFIRKILTNVKLLRENIRLTQYEKRALFFTRSKQDRFLYDELFHVPLILAGKGIPQNKIIHQQIRNIDIFPTLIDLIGIPNLKYKIDGESFLPLILDKHLKEKPVYMESGMWFDDKSKSAIGIRTSNFKYFRGSDKNSGKVHLYDLQNDPFEEKNIAKSRKDVTEDMEKILCSIRNDLVKDFKDHDEISENEKQEIEEQLRKLGYI